MFYVSTLPENTSLYASINSMRNESILNCEEYLGEEKMYGEHRNRHLQTENIYFLQFQRLDVHIKGASMVR